MGKLIYAAIPKRLTYCLSEINRTITAEGNLPIITLYAFPIQENGHYEKFRLEIKRAAQGMVEKCDELLIFGIGRGSLKDYEYAVEKGKPVGSLIKKFDMEWESKAIHDRYKEYRHIIEQIVGKSVLEELLAQKDKFDKNGAIIPETPQRYLNPPFIY